jgi:hypothetical protein
MFGAIREDDNPAEDPPTPQDIAPGLKRPLHHFYDPYFNRPLDMTGLSVLDPDVHKNPDWAIGSRDSFADSNKPEAGRRNTFTVFDAREAMFRALTMMTRIDGTYVKLTPGDPAVSEQWRQAYWATTFRALGDVLHLNQDMAQPQHTRNEPHSGKYCFEFWCAAGHTSVYEKYINARALGTEMFNSLAPFKVPVKMSPRPLPLAGYSMIPAFGRYSDYWATAPGTASGNGKGLAEFSNRSFFTAKMNLGEAENAFPLPSRDPSQYAIVGQSPTRWDGSGSEDMSLVKVLYGSVKDTLEDTVYSSVPLSTQGVWDQFLVRKSSPAKYSLNRLNYDAMADMLLPRAVAYSAGLINFFFRGRLEISLPDEGAFAVADHGPKAGFRTLRAKLKNTTSMFDDANGAPQPQSMAGGTFFAVIRYHTDKKYVGDISTIVGYAPCDQYFEVVDATNPASSTDCRDGVEQIIVSKPLGGESLGVDEERTFKFDFTDSPIPFGMTDVVLQVVYRGPMGSESDAVAVGTIDASEPTYFTYHNASDYIHLGGHVYTRGEINNDPALLALVQPQYCVDYTQSPPRLRDFCLTEFDVDIDLSFGDVTNPLVHATQIRPRHFFRFVYLTAEDPFDESFAKAKPKMHATARRHVTRPAGVGVEKAQLNQQGTCLPLDPFDVPPRHAQLVVVSANLIGYRVDPFRRLRDVDGWFSTSCVVNGDNAEPGTPDDRNEMMRSLDPDTDEMDPVSVTIMSVYQ